MADEIEKDSLRQLKKIERELSAIKERTSNPKRMFINGILYGAGAFVGGILAVAAIGWALSFLGVIPGLSELVEYMQGLMSLRGK